MKDSKKIDFSIGALTTLNSMKETVQDSVLASLARLASNHFNTLKVKPLNNSDNSYFIRLNKDITLVFMLKGDTLYVTNILSDFLIESFQKSIESRKYYEKI